MPVVPITEAEELPTTFETRQPHQTVLMVTPNTYRVGEHINPHMHGTAETTAAEREWEALYQMYTAVGDVAVIDPLDVHDHFPSFRDPSELPDIVFAANQTLTHGERQEVILSNMATGQRKGEEAYFDVFFDERGWTRHTLPDAIQFEGTGDALWHPNRNLLWGGHGIRSDREAYEHVAELFDTTVYTIPLTDERYYHLDTCFMPLDEETVLVAEDAFDEAVQTAIERLWETVLWVPASEANDLSCNVHAVTDSLVFMGAGAPKTRRLIQDAGFDVRVATVDEFNKAGGGVFCLRQTF